MTILDIILYDTSEGFLASRLRCVKSGDLKICNSLARYLYESGTAVLGDKMIYDSGVWGTMRVEQIPVGK